MPEWEPNQELYEEWVAEKNELLLQLEQAQKKIQKYCRHRDIVRSGGGDYGDGDKSYSIRCNNCGLSGYHYVGYGGYDAEAHMSDNYKFLQGVK